jgi:uncharacterized protein (TIGR00730 family)
MSSTPSAGGRARPLASVCVFCASSDGQEPRFIQGAQRLGALLAEAGVRLVYGGGGVGLMGACARAAHAAGGEVLGVMPDFLRNREMAFDAVETLFVPSMHVRKATMFEQSDGFAILPGGIGTLEEVIEILSWRRLGLHRKPVVFLNPDDYWTPLFELFDHTIRKGLTPVWFERTWRAVRTAEEVLPALGEMACESGPAEPNLASLT